MCWDLFSQLYDKWHAQKNSIMERYSLQKMGLKLLQNEWQILFIFNRTAAL